MKYMFPNLTAADSQHLHRAATQAQVEDVGQTAEFLRRLRAAGRLPAGPVGKLRIAQLRQQHFAQWLACDPRSERAARR